MSAPSRVVVALSGGVDSAVAALLLAEAGHRVECLHMSNWEDDGYCDNAREYQHAREVCGTLGLPLHRVNFATEYRAAVFAEFLDELRSGRTPNPDVLCNREIKFGVMRDYARRLGGDFLATGHYARLEPAPGGPRLLKARDRAKDQSYFLHRVTRAQLDGALFPLGELTKHEVRQRAAQAGLAVADKKDSTGICFIGERPFAEFLRNYLPPSPGPIVTLTGDVLGTHCGLAWYTLGQRHGLQIGGSRRHGPQPWYVAAKRSADNALVVVQGTDHPALYSRELIAESPSWLDERAAAAARSGALVCTAKTRYRQPDQPATVSRSDTDRLTVTFRTPQRAVTPGQFVVFYDAERCLGGARIAAVKSALSESANHADPSRVA